MDWNWWERAIAAAVVVVIALALARLADRALTRRLRLAPETLTRYRVLRRTVVAGIVAVGVLSALLLIPPVRAAAGSILASSALVGLVVGFAARSTLANFVAGILIALTQPLRLGDRVQVAGTTGTVEEVGLTYTVLRTLDGAHFYVPNERLASDTIRNETIAGSEHLAQVSVPVPLAADLERALALLREEAERASEGTTAKEPVASVSQLDPSGATLTIEAWAESPAEAALLAAGIRRAAHRRLRAEGIYAA